MGNGLFSAPHSIKFVCLPLLSQTRNQEGPNARVRVFIPTYRRNKMLERAIGSLRAQTFTDWICEVHNDDPNDTFPNVFINSLNDNRFKLCNHDRNLGPCEMFNLFFRPTQEPYFTMLEDDNWWHPEFLSTMVHELGGHPSVTFAWCNQKIWEEFPDGSWRDTGQFVSPLEENAPSRLYEFGNKKQVTGFLHSNGGMLIRSRIDGSYTVPADWPFIGEEALRERLIPHPLLYIPKPLANFARTLKTARSQWRVEWDVVQTVLAATFLKHANYDEARLSRLFSDARSQWPPATNPLLFAALIQPPLRNLLRHSRTRDWLILLRGIIRRPNVLWGMIRCQQRYQKSWLALDRSTAARFAELKVQVEREKSEHLYLDS
jgi:glycosyltransferase involved in cell wall biosynthesis